MWLYGKTRETKYGLHGGSDRWGGGGGGGEEEYTEIGSTSAYSMRLSRSKTIIVADILFSWFVFIYVANSMFWE